VRYRAYPAVTRRLAARCHPHRPCGSRKDAERWTRQGHIPLPASPSGGTGGPPMAVTGWSIRSSWGFDGSPSSRNALAYAGGVAHRLGRSLLVVHVSSPGMFCEPLTGQVIGLPEHTSELESWLLTELDRSTDRSGLDVHVLTRRGSPARELAAAAAEQDADALIIGAPSRAWHRMGGSVPGWLARHARCPVIVVP